MELRSHNILNFVRVGHKFDLLNGLTLYESITITYLHNVDISGVRTYLYKTTDDPL